jgi:hypothetical protein
VGLGLNLGPHICKACALLLDPDLQSIFAWVILEIRIRTVHPDWPQTVILLVSVSQVARIAGVSHWHLAPCCFHSCIYGEKTDAFSFKKFDNDLIRAV